MNITEYDNPLVRKKANKSKLENVTTVALVVFLSGGISSLAFVNTFLSALSILFLIYVATKYKARFLYFLTLDKILLLLLLTAFLSIFWSEVPQNTLEALVYITRVTGFGVYFAMRYNFREQIKLLAWSFLVIVILSFLVGAIDSNPNRAFRVTNWMAGFPHKNYFGRNMAMYGSTFLVILLSEKTKKSRKYIWIFSIAISMIMVIFSGSVNSLVHISFSFLVLIPTCYLLRSKYEIKVPTLWFLILPSVLSLNWFLTEYENIAVEVLDRQHSFGGRDTLKQVLLERFIWQKPILGHGISGFWNHESNFISVSNAIDLIQAHRGQPWVPTHAHSGFIDLMLSLGVVGLILFFISFLVAYFNSILLVSRSQTAVGFWPFIFLTLFFLSNINVNSTILAARELYWALYVSTTISLKIWPKRDIT